MEKNELMVGSESDLFTFPDVRKSTSLSSISSRKSKSNRSKSDNFKQLQQKLPSHGLVHKDSAYFDSIFPDANESLIDDFSCALSRTILEQGRLYLTDNALYFSSAFFEPLILHYEKIKKITPNNFIFTTGIDIATTDGKDYRIQSFLPGYRDMALSYLEKLWLTRITALALAKNSRPNSEISLDFNNTQHQQQSEISESTLNSFTKTVKNADIQENTNNSVTPESNLNRDSVIDCDCLLTIHDQYYTLVDDIIKVNAKRLFEILFFTKGDIEGENFFKNFLEKRGCTSLHIGSWKENSEHEKEYSDYETLHAGLEREVQYKISLGGGCYQPLTKVKSRILTFSHECICIQSITKAIEVPFGKNFQTNVRFCILNQDIDSCRIVISYEVEFTGTVPMKSLVLNPLKSEIIKYHEDFKAQLKGYIKALSNNDTVTSDQATHAKIEDTNKVNIVKNNINVIPDGSEPVASSRYTENTFTKAANLQHSDMEKKFNEKLNYLNFKLNLILFRIKEKS
ncbi:hypothetical protein HDU92_002043 [Lobulomyces angularis]|nr:hypothetical protein HDU92_002043 [Lobulomyces angularis]